MAFLLYVSAVFAVILLALIWKYWLVAPIKSVKGGYVDDLIIPHTEPIELYFADISACSMKVRMCLNLAGVKFNPHRMLLPSAGSWETKSRDFLRINPAGTVPVLVYNGHPIYESSEQIQFVAKNLVGDATQPLIPHGSEANLVNNYWLEKTSWYTAELLEDIEGALKKRVGNCIPIISIPSFAAIVTKLSWKTVLKGMLILGCTDKQAFNVIFSFFGVHAFKLLPKLAKIVKLGKLRLFEHLKELEDFLNVKGTKFICNGHLTLADVGWAPILERMELVGWWEYVDPSVFPCLTRYWNDMKSQPAYKEATRIDTGLEDDYVSDLKSMIKDWKFRYPWFRDMYE